MKRQIRKILTLVMILAGVTTSVFAQQGFGITKPDASALVDITSTTMGFLPPRMTDAQMAAIASPAEGLVVYNTTRHCMMYYSSGAWISFSVTSSAQLPVASAVSPYGSFALGGIVNVSYIYYQATGIAAGTPIYQWYSSPTGVDANKVALLDGTGNPYTNTVGAGKYLAVGVTPVTSTGIRGTEVMSPWYQVGIDCPGTMTVNHVTGWGAPLDKTVTYNVVSTTLGGSGPKCWITQNLGADHEATSATDGTEASAGWYWQFNRVQGYKHDGSTRLPSVWNPVTNEFSNWLLDNDPCALQLGAGWRLPTRAEWATAIGPWYDFTAAFNSVLKLHAAGLLNSDGSLGFRGSFGAYWSSTQYDASTGAYMGMNSGTSTMTYVVKDRGQSVRCLRDY